MQSVTSNAVSSFISKYSIIENNTVETTIDCNSGESQNYGFLALINYHSSSGDATTFDLRMIRTGYNGNCISEQRIRVMNATGDQDNLTFIAQNNKIAIKNNSSSKRFDVTIIGFN